MFDARSFGLWLVCLAACGCGGRVNGTTSTSSSTDAAADAMGVDALDDGGVSTTDGAVTVADAPIEVAPPLPTGAWFAMRTFEMGIKPRPGSTTRPSKAWQDFGFDLDSRNTDLTASASANTPDGAKAANTCMRAAGSSSNYLVDGPGGVDNNFGQFFVQTVKSLKSDAEDVLNADIASGTWTYLVWLDHVPTGDDPSVPGALYLAGRTSTPSFTTADHWPLDASSVVGKSLSPKLSFPSGSVKGGVWSSGAGINGELPIPMLGTPSAVPVQGLVVSMRLDGSRGNIGAVAPLAGFVKALEPVAATFGICPGTPTYATLSDSIGRAVDVVAGVPQFQTPGAPCDSMSIGLGFEGSPTGTPGSVAPSPPPGTSLCP